MTEKQYQQESHAAQVSADQEGCHDSKEPVSAESLAGVRYKRRLPDDMPAYSGTPDDYEFYEFG